jgi:hypothetical protein
MPLSICLGLVPERYPSVWIEENARLDYRSLRYRNAEKFVGACVVTALTCHRDQAYAILRMYLQRGFFLRKYKLLLH